ncbi:Putative 8-oxoguanine DNA glycosylase [Aspergillus calidoustus]|uniref:DNA-(apurinic or apyrimidinic site) lyase n=1 Tax=Aspergillus calidoustus TaxID=454130 RepID=A0A0U4ZZ41_ASPCI|nr:Putative 8-oxoguanine DNA glycosylase [Aspergillus calidoustus]
MMTVGAFSEWRKLPISLSELCINTTLRCGQSFRWHKLPDNDEWRCVLYGRLLSLKQDPTHLYYRTYSAASATNGADETEDTTLAIIKHYFNLTSNLTTLYAQWSSSDPNFRKKAPQFTGIRILRQDAWEALVSFICSSNNNIARISQMVEKLCVNYGVHVADIDGRAYHDFPSPERLADGGEVEARLRSLGFGYRAKYIYQTSLIVAKQRDEGWLNTLRNPEAPAFGVEFKAVSEGDDEIAPEGRSGYREAHEKLLELQGVGPKVSDCVCLMGLGWGESVPVDTHVWQIAQRDYKFGKGGNKSLTKATYDAVGNHFRKLWGKEAGWAHSVLFTADLRTFSDRLVATTKKTEVKVDVKVKEEGEEDGTKVTAATVVKKIALKRTTDEGEIKLELDDEKDLTKTRRMSKRLRSR